jgi:type III secretory pathway component EscR
MTLFYTLRFVRKPILCISCVMLRDHNTTSYHIEILKKTQDSYTNYVENIKERKQKQYINLIKKKKKKKRFETL